jgi:environmental stress-induced protein Ves
MEVVRFSRLREQRWANGAGTTTELHRIDRPGSEWAGRISVAVINEPGPFSTYPGVDRTLICLGPDMMTLVVEGSVVRLAPLERLDFTGEAEVETLRGDEQTLDLNVMTRRGAATSSTSLEHIVETRHLAAEAGEVLIICSLTGTVRVSGETLAVFDVAVVRGNRRRTVEVQGTGTAAVIRFRIHSTSGPIAGRTAPGTDAQYVLGYD